MEQSQERLGSRKLAERLRSEVERGERAPGSKLPSYRDLARELGLSINTVRESLRTLEQQGIVSIEHGRGAFVAENPDGIDAADALRTARAEIEEICAVLRDSATALTKAEQRLSQVVDGLPRSD